MNRDHVKAHWDQLKGNVKAKWGKLTDHDMTLVGGKWDQFVASCVTTTAPRIPFPRHEDERHGGALNV